MTATDTRKLCKGAETGQCDRPARINGDGYGTYCYAHQRRKERDGDPQLDVPIGRYRKGRGEHFGENDYRGAGILMCLCGRPYAEHEIAERCYEVGP